MASFGADEIEMLGDDEYDVFMASDPDPRYVTPLAKRLLNALNRELRSMLQECTDT